MEKMPDTSVRRNRAATFFAIIVCAILFAGIVFLAAGHSHGGAGGQVSATGKWTCSMCPQFILPAPGKCPKCFMDLIPLENAAGSGGRFEIILSHAAALTAGIESAIVEKTRPQQAANASYDPAGKSRDAAAGETVYVPASAVLRNVGRAFVFVEANEGDNWSFTLREIQLGETRDNTAEVRSGLYEGEAVVSKGAFRLDSALQILGKISLVNLPPENLALVPQEEEREPYQPAERVDVDLRAEGIPLDEWFKDYEAVRAALAKDDFAASTKPANLLYEALGKNSPENAPGKLAGGDADFASLQASLKQNAGLLELSKNLGEKRDAFEKVSADMVLLARKYGAPKSSLNLIFCPMAFGGTGAYWLQPQDKVDNPYHGLEMPECGWQVEKIEP